MKLFSTVLAGSALLVGCGNVAAPGGAEGDARDNRAIVSSSSSRNDLKKESKDLGKSVEDINNRFEDITRICDDLDERAVAYNATLAERESALAQLQTEADALKDQIDPIVTQLKISVLALGTAQGKVAGHNKTIAMLNSPSTLRRAVAEEKARLQKDLGKAKKELNEALRTQKKAPYPSAQFDTANSGVITAKGKIAFLEAQKLVVVAAEQGNINDQIAYNQAQLAILQPQVTTLTATIQATNAALSPLFSQYQAKITAIKNTNTADGLQPVFVPPICSNLD